MNYQKPGKKATTILSPNLETIDYGSIIIVLDNSQTSLPIDQAISGKIKVNLFKEFDASAITLNLCGYQRSHFKAPEESSNFQGQSQGTRLAKTIISQNLVITEFPEGSNPLNGQSEYAFSLKLPEVVSESIMLQFA